MIRALEFMEAAMGQMLERKFYLFALLVLSLAACAAPTPRSLPTATATAVPATGLPEIHGKLQLIEFFASV
jgi:hypothetical protein